MFSDASLLSSEIADEVEGINKKPSSSLVLFACCFPLHHGKAPAADILNRVIVNRELQHVK